ncbi:L-aminopeptidase/D-esterase [Salinibacillus kushneri]|uniref:L-aminopeptidase/D-esterase n=1 Tax=Salinibacillus kushneri TaxID=237682 RepID=A0A1I0DLE5_9BACI|nr:P1 family peptidase [Salinibacillus kushneri]SET32922.1 L-aminopeptidase/D-esterase [Salinibacillus kushneri]
MKEIAFSELEGFRLGHAQDHVALSGCSVVICEEGAIGGVDVRGGSPGTRETDLLDPNNLVEEVHAVFLSGGSAYGLNTGGGIMQYLEEQKIGFDVQVARVPIVAGAILFDLLPGNPAIRPDHQMGYKASQNAFIKQEDMNGNIGAGTGATVGKALGPEFAMKGGLGTYAVQIGSFQIGAVVAVNCFGDVVDPGTGEIIAGAYDSNNSTLLSSEENLLSQLNQYEKTNRFKGNTTIGVLVTNAKLTKGQANKISSITHDSLARTMRPSHSLVDGDTIFTMSSNQVEVELNSLGMLASTVMEKAILRGVKAAKGVDGLFSYQDIT